MPGFRLQRRRTVRNDGAGVGSLWECLGGARGLLVMLGMAETGYEKALLPIEASRAPKRAGSLEPAALAALLVIFGSGQTPIHLIKGQDCKACGTISTEHDPLGPSMGRIAGLNVRCDFHGRSW